MVLNTAKRLGRRALERTSLGYRFLLKRDHGITGPHGYPDAPWSNAVLQTQHEVQASIDQVRRLGLPVMDDLPKNWDSLAALDLILKNTTTQARILDAGGEFYSVILPWLFLYGYRNLTAGNLVIPGRTRRGAILYEQADITATAYPDGWFDAITCLSVIEHGVDPDAYFREMARVLKTGGLLITSTDYWETPVDPGGQSAYGAPIRIFTRDDIAAMVALAQRYGFTPTSTIDLTAKDKVVHWKQYDLRYTFAVFSMRKNSISAA